MRTHGKCVHILHINLYKTFIQLMRIISHKISPLFKWNVPTQLYTYTEKYIENIRKTCNGRSVVVVVVFCEGELDYYFLCSTDGPMCSFAQNSKQSKPLLLLLLPCFIHSYFESLSLSDACLSVRLTSRQKYKHKKSCFLPRLYQTKLCIYCYPSKHVILLYKVCSMQFGEETVVV